MYSSLSKVRLRMQSELRLPPSVPQLVLLAEGQTGFWLGFLLSLKFWRYKNFAKCEYLIGLWLRMLLFSKFLRYKYFVKFWHKTIIKISRASLTPPPLAMICWEILWTASSTKLDFTYNNNSHISHFKLLIYWYFTIFSQHQSHVT